VNAGLRTERAGESGAPAPTFLEARGVGYTVDGTKILEAVDLAVGAGERLAVVGPSGSGKTTLLSLLGGLSRPSSGRVLLDGEVLDTVAGPDRGVAMVLQGYGLVSLLTASENVEIALRSAGRSRAEAAREAAEALMAVGLAAQADHLVEELSGGQQQRTAVARALSLQPRLLIADEPTAELDPASRTLTLARMLEITETGAALVLATHDAEVAAACHRVLDLAGTATWRL
jgi:ABC-type lipoprotein export system ATPase subunit